MATQNLFEARVTNANEVHILGYEHTFVLWVTFDEFHKIRFETEKSDWCYKHVSFHFCYIYTDSRRKHAFSYIYNARNITSKPLGYTPSLGDV
jgi:hypothetical protein